MDRFLLVLPKNGGKKRPASSISTTSIKSTHATSSLASSYDTASTSKHRKLVQHFLDFGQKNFGATAQCIRCSLFYVADDPEDMARHKRVCKQVDKPPQVSLKGLCRDQQLYTSDDALDQIFVVPIDATKVHGDIVTKIYPLVEQDLDASTEFLYAAAASTQTYIYVRGQNVIGMLIAEDLSRQDKHLVRYIQHINDLSRLDDTSSSPRLPQELEKEREDRNHQIPSFFVGVRVIWVHRTHREHGVARQLLDTMRTHYCFGRHISVHSLAFSQPTSSGLAFAQRYLQRHLCPKSRESLQSDDSKSMRTAPSALTSPATESSPAPARHISPHASIFTPEIAPDSTDNHSRSQMPSLLASDSPRTTSSSPVSVPCYI